MRIPKRFFMNRIMPTLHLQKSVACAAIEPVGVECEVWHGVEGPGGGVLTFPSRPWGLTLVMLLPLTQRTQFIS